MRCRSNVTCDSLHRWDERKDTEDSHTLSGGRSAPPDALARLGTGSVRPQAPSSASSLTCDLRLLWLHELAHHGQDVLSPLQRRRLRNQSCFLRQLQMPHRYPQPPCPSSTAPRQLVNSTGVLRCGGPGHLHWKLEELLNTGVFKRFPRAARIKQNAFVGRTSSVGPPPPPRPCLFPVPDGFTPQDCQLFPGHPALLDSIRAHLSGTTVCFLGSPSVGRLTPTLSCCSSPLGTDAWTRVPPPPTRPGYQTCSEPRACPCSWLTPRRLTSCCTHLPAPQCR